MGRKKRKVNDDDNDNEEAAALAGGDGDDDERANTTADASLPDAPPGGTTTGSSGEKEEPGTVPVSAVQRAKELGGAAAGGAATAVTTATAAATVPPPSSSGYAMTSHSGEIVHEDVYVSDGSEDSDVEMIIVNSRNGIMRRGIGGGAGGVGGAAMIRPYRQWVRGGGKDGDGNDNDQDGEGDDRSAEGGKDDENPSLVETLANLDPAQRAARLLQEKQRKQELEKILARQHEAEQNAGRDPALFSKRTAFDIRFDQIEDKPWLRGSGEMADFFNYDFQEEDWLEYGQQQLQIRQELVEAARQKRPVDPNIVPVIPKTPANQAPRVAVAASPGGVGGAAADGSGSAVGTSGDVADEIVAGPQAAPHPTGATETEAPEKPSQVDERRYADLKVVGGAWGAVEGSKLAKLIEEQEKHSAAVDVAVSALDAAIGASSKKPDGAGDYYEEDDRSRGSGRGGGDEEYDKEPYDREEDNEFYHRESKNLPGGGPSNSEDRTSSRYREGDSRNKEEGSSTRHRRDSGGRDARDSRRRDDRPDDSRRRDDRPDRYGDYDSYAGREAVGAWQYEDAAYGSYYRGQGGYDPGSYRSEYQDRGGYDERGGYYDTSHRHHSGRDEWYPPHQDSSVPYERQGTNEGDYRDGGEGTYVEHGAGSEHVPETSSSRQGEKRAPEKKSRKRRRDRRR